MSRIPEHIISQITDRADIVEIVGEVVSLKRTGASYKACCPYHNEKTPSFVVTPSRNAYHCFGCGCGGDAISFLMKYHNITFVEAIERLAKRYCIDIPREEIILSDEQKREAKERESMLIVLEQVQQYFVDCLHADNAESASARDYTFNRWDKEFCISKGLGFAPGPTQDFIAWYKSKAIPEETLIKVGILRRNEDDGTVYPLLRQRMTIPIRNRWGRVIAFTARYIGSKSGIAKYMNSPTSLVFKKDETIFGLDVAAKAIQEKNMVYIVEGAADVLRLQSIGINNVVASLGTAWSGKQFKILKQFTNSICFIPDSDPPPDDKPFGAGFEAVMRNGADALRQGLGVTVRELPFGENNSKNDVDAYLNSCDVLYSLNEKHFIVWLAEKRFGIANSLAEQRQCVADITELLTHIEDKLVVEQCIEELAKIHGKIKLWRNSINDAISNKVSSTSRDLASQNDEVQHEIDTLRRYNLFIRNNCYYSADGDNEPKRLSNFILEPLYHIQDENNGTRIFKMINNENDVRIIELKEGDMVSLSTFQQRVSSQGYFIWKAKIDKLNNVKEYRYSRTPSAERVRKMGWDNCNDVYIFGNGIFSQGKFRKVDEMGIVSLGGSVNKVLYIPATSVMYRNNVEIFQFERLFIHEDNNNIKLRALVQKLIDVFGDNAKIGFCYLLATLFRDVIFLRTRHFPLLNLFGEKGTGKTTLATSLQSFFIHGIDPPNLGVATIPALNDRVSQSVNSLVVMDEYKNDMDVKKIAFLKGLWGGGGQTKKNVNADGGAAQTIVSTGIALCGQDKPTQDMALFSRVIFLPFTRNEFNSDERRAYDELTAICNQGNTHLTLEILSHRLHFEKTFGDMYKVTKQELSTRLKDDNIMDRVLNNWVIPLAAFRTLETVIDVPFSYSELFEIAVAGVIRQNTDCNNNSEMAEFWNMLQGYHSQGKVIEKTHFRIKYKRSFRSASMTEPMIFSEPRPILYLNPYAVSVLFGARAGGSPTANRSNWDTMVSYLKSQDYFLGHRQDRFTVLLANGTQDYTVELVGTKTVKKEKVVRPNALCFDYSQLKQKFGLMLETEVIAEDDESHDVEDIVPPSPPRHEELPF